MYVDFPTATHGRAWYAIYTCYHPLVLHLDYSQFCLIPATVSPHYIPIVHVCSLSHALVTSCFSWRCWDLLVAVLFIIEGGQGRVTRPGYQVGGWGWGWPVPRCPITCSSSVEELVQGSGIGSMLWGCVGQRVSMRGRGWVVGWWHEQVVAGRWHSRMNLMIHPRGVGSIGCVLPVMNMGGCTLAQQLPCHFTSQGGNHLTARFPATIYAPVLLQSTLPWAVAWGG